MSQSPSNTSKNVLAEAQNVFTDPILMKPNETAAISLGGTRDDNTASVWAGSTVTVQRRWKTDKLTDWRDVQQFTAAAEVGFTAECSMQLRVGVKTGDYTASDSIQIDTRIG